MGDFAIQIKKTEKGKRVKLLTRDTAYCLAQTCYGLVQLSKYLLDTTHQYVLLGNFTTDPLEKLFGKLRQGSGGTYFISIQQVLEKVTIYRTKLLLKFEKSSDVLGNLGSDHSHTIFVQNVKFYQARVFATLMTIYLLCVIH